MEILLLFLQKEGPYNKNFLKPAKNTESEKFLARTFANLMFKGKTKATLDLLANCGRDGVLHLDLPANPDDPDSRSVREVFEGKHPT